jgi:hypothetical protein
MDDYEMDSAAAGRVSDYFNVTLGKWRSPGLVDIPGSVIRARGVIHGKTQAT